MNRARHLPLVLLGLVVLVLVFPPAVDSLGDTLVRASVLGGFTIAAWAFGLFAEPIASLVFFLLAAVFHIAKPGVIFSGFQSTAWCLVFGGYINRIRADTTGLGRRPARLW